MPSISKIWLKLNKIVLKHVFLAIFSGAFVVFFLPQVAQAQTVTSTIKDFLSGLLPSALSSLKDDNDTGFNNRLIVAKEKPRRVVYITVTAYSSTQDQTDDTPFITARGTQVRDGIIAANFLRFGTRVRFPNMFGEKEFTVEDRMHPRFSERADIWMETREEAKQFGIRRLKMEVY